LDNDTLTHLIDGSSTTCCRGAVRTRGTGDCRMHSCTTFLFTSDVFSRSGFVLRLNEDRLSGLRFVFGFLIDRSGAKGVATQSGRGLWV
jgi:hypothetical protein